MATKCFLSYSFGYRHIMDAIRHLLEVLEFEAIDVFEGPDDQHPPASVVEQRIANADCVVILYGPPAPPDGRSGATDAARWVTEEALMSYGAKKPLTLILHAGTQLPALLQAYQSPPRFDFWNPTSFFENAHHVVKHLRDLKRRIDLPQGPFPYVFTKAIMRNRISPRGQLLIEVYHEVIARQTREKFHHALDTGDDHSKEAIIQLVAPDAYEVEATFGDPHEIVIEPGATSANKFEYMVHLKPPLRPGEKFGYRRSFEVNNRFPLTRADIERRSRLEGFPKTNFGDRFYGDSIDVLSEMELFTIAFHFPRRIKLANWKAIALEYSSRILNKAETERANSKDNMRLKEDPGDPERVLELVVIRPLINHSYYLLYEPAD